MSFLAIVVAVKVVGTAATTALPFLVSPARDLTAMTGVGAEGVTLIRLYGVAILALLVGYASGFWFLSKGDFPWAVVLMGIVSNAGAVAVLILTGSWRRFLWMTIFLAGLALMLCVAALLPNVAIQSIW